MKISFLGCSSFLIENMHGSRILVDPFDDSPEWTFGLSFPRNITTDLVLMSHMDADHASFRPSISREASGFASQKKSYQLKFPNLALRGTIVYEWSGFPNIAWTYNVDGMRFLHLADNAHPLTKLQLDQFGEINILFISPSKMKYGNKVVLENIKKINPDLVIWSHHIPVKPCNEEREQKIRQYFSKIVLACNKNKHASQFSADVFANFIINILEMNRNFKNVANCDSGSYEIKGKNAKTKERPLILYFRNNIAKLK